MKTPTPFPRPPPTPYLVPQGDAIERMKKHAQNVLDLMEIPMTFDEDWHFAVQRAIAGMCSEMVEIVEADTVTDLQPRVKA